MPTKPFGKADLAGLGIYAGGKVRVQFSCIPMSHWPGLTEFGSLSRTISGSGNFNFGGVTLPIPGSEALNLKQSLSVVQANLNYRF